MDLLCLRVLIRVLGVAHSCVLCMCFANMRASCVLHVCASTMYEAYAIVCLRAHERV